MTASDVLAALVRSRYAYPAWALLTEIVRWDPENGRERRADAYFLGLWRTTNFELHGVEVKVSRSDWLAELADPSKASVHVAGTDVWFVAAPAGVVREDEIPEGWGWYELTTHRVRRRRLPEFRKAEITRALAAKLVQRAFILAEHRGTKVAEQRVAAFAKEHGWLVKRAHAAERRVVELERDAPLLMAAGGLS